MDPSRRLTADQAINHPWLATKGEDLATNDLGVGLNQLRIFNATRKLRAAIQSVRGDVGCHVSEREREKLEMRMESFFTLASAVTLEVTLQF